MTTPRYYHVGYTPNSAAVTYWQKTDKDALSKLEEEALNLPQDDKYRNSVSAVLEIMDGPPKEGVLHTENPYTAGLLEVIKQMWTMTSVTVQSHQVKK